MKKKIKCIQSNQLNLKNHSRFHRNLLKRHTKQTHRIFRKKSQFIIKNIISIFSYPQIPITTLYY